MMLTGALPATVFNTSGARVTVLKYDGSAGAFVSATSPSLKALSMTGAEPEVGRKSRAGVMLSQRA